MVTYLLIGVLVTGLGPSEPAVKLTLSASAEVRVRDARNVELGSPTKEIAISQGQPVGVQVVLSNSSLQPSEEMSKELIPNANCWFKVQCPNGTEVVVNSGLWGNGCPEAIASSPLASKEERSLVTWLFTTTIRRKADSRLSNRKAEYLFADEGDYQVYVLYQPTVATSAEKARPREEMRSNSITVHVGKPLPEWRDLQTAEIVAAVESGTQKPDDVEKAKTALASAADTTTVKFFKTWLSTVSEYWKAEEKRNKALQEEWERNRKSTPSGTHK